MLCILNCEQILYLAFENATLFDDRFLREDSIQIHYLSQRVCFWFLPAIKNVKRGRLDLIKDRMHVIWFFSQTTLRVVPIQFGSQTRSFYFRQFAGRVQSLKYGNLYGKQRYFRVQTWTSKHAESCGDIYFSLNRRFSLEKLVSIQTWVTWSSFIGDKYFGNVGFLIFLIGIQVLVMWTRQITNICWVCIKIK